MNESEESIETELCSVRPERCNEILMRVNIAQAHKYIKAQAFFILFTK